MFWAEVLILNKEKKRNQSYSYIKTLAKGENTTLSDPVERGRSLLDFSVMLLYLHLQVNKTALGT